jgi:hypothetical protein
MAHSSFLSFHPVPVLSLLVPTSKSRHNFSFFCTLSPQLLRNFLCYTPLIFPVVSGFFDSFPSFLFVCVFVPFTQLYIHPSSFDPQSFHFFTGIPVSLIVFLALLLFRVFFFSFQHSVNILHSSLLSIFLQTLLLSFPLSLSSYSSCTVPTSFFFNSFFVKWFRLYILSIVPLLFLNPA